MTGPAAASQSSLTRGCCSWRTRPFRTLKVSGAKNSALVLMTASLLTGDVVELSDVPDLTDIAGMGDILRCLGSAWIVRTIACDCRPINSPAQNLHMNSSTASGRASSALAPCSAASAKQRSLPGGCRIRTRPVVEHIRGLKALGAHVSVEHGIVRAAVPGSQHRLKAPQLFSTVPAWEPWKPC